MRQCGILILLSLLPTLGRAANLIEDPISDFLSLPAKEIYTDASEVTRVVVAVMDVDGDGVTDKYVGHPMMWWGDNTGLYGAFYQGTSHGFSRITNKNKLLGVDPRFFGQRSTSFCGYISEKKTQGLLVLENDSIVRNPEDPGLPPLQPKKYARRKLYRIKDKRLIVDDLGPLDLTTPKGKAFYEKYFGKGVKSRPIKFEEFPVEKLKQLGYKIPDWKRPAPPDR